MSIISQWGDSLAVRIPKHIAEQAGLQEGSSVSINVEQGGIVISSQRKKYTLDELLERVDPGDFGGEVDWGAAVGEEVW
ncbi:MAG: AbrB/MazE/SpoVT family DNA-binding domain-containing protein [Cyanophyceae cyanobacterium]